MHLNHKYISVFICVAIVMSSFVSCKKFVDVNPPQTQVTDPIVFSTNQTATSALVGIYSSIMSVPQLFNGYMSILAGLTANDLEPNLSIAPYSNFYLNTITSKDQPIETNWRYGYQQIYQANAVIEGLNKSTGISKNVEDQLMGEAKFLRALTYFYLVETYGDVPLITMTDYKVNSILPRSPSRQIFEQIIQDLNEAVNLLSPTYITSSGYPTDRIRPNKWTASAFLARIYLIQKEWAMAESEASSVINSGIYSLEPNLNNVFLSESKEAIWQLLPVSTSNNTAEGLLFIPGAPGQLSIFKLTTNLINAFEPNDQRWTNWVSLNIISSGMYYYPFKYKIKFGSPPIEYNTVLRLSEQYLIRAEARANQNKIAEGIKDLNIIRNRAGLPNTLADDRNSLLSALERENRIEFFAEWGHRWIDLKRLGKLNAELSIEKSTWKVIDSLWPIPFSQLQTNPLLTQNEGY